MKATFLVTLDLAEADSLDDLADDIEQALSGDFEVTEVKPWHRASLASPVELLSQPPPPGLRLGREL